MHRSRALLACPDCGLLIDHPGRCEFCRSEGCVDLHPDGMEMLADAISLQDKLDRGVPIGALSYLLDEDLRSGPLPEWVRAADPDNPMELAKVPDHFSRPCKAKSGFWGVEAKGRKYRAYIELDGCKRGLGYFVSVEEAARAFDDAAETAWAVRPNESRRRAAAGLAGSPPERLKAEPHVGCLARCNGPRDAIA